MLFISIAPIYKGIIELYKNFDNISSYRIAGDTYTTRYAAELGIYLLLGILSFLYYKKVYIKILLTCYMIIVLTLIFFTQSRNDFLVIPIILIFIFIIIDWKKGLIATIVILALMFSLFKYTGKTDRIKVINRIETSIMTKEKMKKDARYTIFLEVVSILSLSLNLL